MYLSKETLPSPDNYDLKGVIYQNVSSKIIKISKNIKEYCIGCNYELLIVCPLNTVITLTLNLYNNESNCIFLLFINLLKVIDL